MECYRWIAGGQMSRSTVSQTSSGCPTSLNFTSEMTDSEVLALFSYSKEERSTFGYLDSYMRRVEGQIQRGFTGHAQRRAFVVAGLFLTYRASNHSGMPMSTVPSDLADYADGVHKQRLLSCEAAAGISFRTQSEYLKLIGFPYNVLSALRPAAFLARLVMRGHRH